MAIQPGHQIKIQVYTNGQHITVKHVYTTTNGNEEDGFTYSLDVENATGFASLLESAVHEVHAEHARQLPYIVLACVPERISSDREKQEKENQ